jgi:hypothetical protein
MSEPCPCCDVANGICTPTEALALGVALGAAFGQEKTREMMCSRHRTRYVMAMLQTVVKLQGLENESEEQEKA